MTFPAVVAELLALADAGPPTAQQVRDALAGRELDIKIWDDSRGWGAYAELQVTSGSLVELQAIIGATRPVPRNPGDFHSGDRVAAYVERGGKTVRVFVELSKQDTAQVRSVTVHYQR